MNKKLKIVILISGRGSNMEALINATSSPDFPAEIIAVISNNPDAKGIEKAKEKNIKTKVINHKDYNNKHDFETAIIEYLAPLKPDLICLAGFMRILSSDFIKHYPKQIINIHPSLLPKFKGLDTHKRAIEAGEKESGCTVHYVIPEMDAGPIILQRSVTIESDETEESLAKKILEQEHIAYPEAIKIIHRNTLK